MLIRELEKCEKELLKVEEKLKAELEDV